MGTDRDVRQADQVDAHHTGGRSISPSAEDVIVGLPEGAMLLAKKGYDPNALCLTVKEQKAWANISPKANRQRSDLLPPLLHKARKPVERFINKAGRFRRKAIRYDKLAENYPAAFKPISIRMRLRSNASTSC